MRKRTVTVSDKMQKGYRYVLSVPPGRGFDPEFKPQLTPAQMLKLGVFGGKYMTDCRREFPGSWFAGAKLSPHGRDRALQFLRRRREPAALGMEEAKAGFTRTIRAAGFNGTAAITWAAVCRTRTAADQALEGDPTARAASREILRARRPVLPATSTAGAAALGLRQPQDLTADLLPCPRALRFYPINVTKICLGGRL